MKYLLDTSVLLWCLADERVKIAEFMHIINDDRNYIAVSVVSYWEIAIKKGLGKLTAPNNLVDIVEESGFAWINLETKHIEQLEKLPAIHTDPFDRLLVAQAKADCFTLLTTERILAQY
ncbi:MAG TPA: type II toxin-antitoxin system VapC family toxin [Gammaproteobacteria bacterium]|nr:type II toxin-antitoxin system VapC family toxin [Gammaproteobacteria bacterium]